MNYVFEFEKMGAAAFGVGVIACAVSLTRYLNTWAHVAALVVGFLLALWLLSYIRALFDRARKRMTKARIKPKQRKSGLFSFWKNRRGAVADVLLLACMLALVLAVAFRCAPVWMMSILRGVAASAFVNHCIFNGGWYNAALSETN